ncbi:MAG: glycoside hydrolase family 36 N-terminal domain-containing protein [Dorea sp.]
MQREDEAETLEIVLTDRASGLKAHLLYGVFPHLDVITRAVRLENTGYSTGYSEKSNVYGKWTMSTENWMQSISMAAHYGTPDGENSPWSWQLVCGKYPWNLQPSSQSICDPL